MNIIKRYFSSFAAFMSATPAANENQRSYNLRGSSGRGRNAQGKTGNFDVDYRSASVMLRERINKRFPDDFHTRVGASINSSRDFGDKRAEAIDTASAAIAEALRNGATVKKAAEAGAASVGI